MCATARQWYIRCRSRPRSGSENSAESPRRRRRSRGRRSRAKDPIRAHIDRCIVKIDPETNSHSVAELVGAGHADLRDGDVRRGLIGEEPCGPVLQKRPVGGPGRLEVDELGPIDRHRPGLASGVHERLKRCGAHVGREVACGHRAAELRGALERQHGRERGQTSFDRDLRRGELRQPRRVGQRGGRVVGEADERAAHCPTEGTRIREVELNAGVGLDVRLREAGSDPPWLRTRTRCRPPCDRPSSTRNAWPQTSSVRIVTHIGARCLAGLGQGMGHARPHSMPGTPAGGASRRRVARYETEVAVLPSDVPPSGQHRLVRTDRGGRWRRTPRSSGHVR